MEMSGFFKSTMKILLGERMIFNDNLPILLWKGMLFDGNWSFVMILCYEIMVSSIILTVRGGFEV